MFHRSKRSPLGSAAALALALVTASLPACDEPGDPTAPCTDCQGDCTLDEGFDFESPIPEEACPGQTGAPPALCPSAFGENPAGCVEPTFSIEEATIGQVHEALAQGTITCEWLTARHLERALQHDLRMQDGQPPLNAFVALNAAALETARKLDRHQQCAAPGTSSLAGPLHCIPFVIKTNYASREVPTTNGTLAMGEAQAAEDAFVVHRLREAGAILLGSTAMDEFAQGIHGIGSRSGRTGNAYDTRRFAGGSSSGSGVAVAASFAMAGLGTDNCASLTVPAAYNGLVTLRPSFGLVSTEGIFPSNRLDAVAGPMTRTVEDLARLLDVITERNPRDPNHCDEAPPRPPSFMEALKPAGLEGRRIGVLRDLSENANTWDRYPFEGTTEAMQTHSAAFLAELEALGAEIVDPVVLPEFQGRRYGSGSGYEANIFLAHTTGGPQSMSELCRSGLYSKSVFESEEDCLAQSSQTLEQLNANLERGQQAYRDNRAYVEGALDALGLDALVFPADSLGSAQLSNSKANCIVSSTTGLPSVVVQAGHLPSGMPVGMMFTARMNEDATLLHMAYSYEQATRHRRPPSLPNVERPVQLDPAQFNALHLALGQRAFEEVLQTQSKWSLTPAKFADIAREVLLEAGHPDLAGLPPAEP